MTEEKPKGVLKAQSNISRIIPDDLKHTVILMAADLFRYDVSASSGQYDNVTSIKEGDVTVSYGSNSSSMSSVFKDYKARLARFRKLVW